MITSITLPALSISPRRQFRVRILPALALAAAGVIGAASAGAAVVVDFNQNTVGAISGQAGGLSTGLSGSWTSNSTLAQVVSGGDLSSTYAIAQTGTGQAFSTTSTNSVGAGVSYNSLTTGLTGDIYVSFLANSTDATGRVGVGFNNTTFDVNTPALTLLFVNHPTNTPTLLVRNGSTVLSTLSLASAGALSTTQFVVARISVNANGAGDQVQVWLNPDLSSGTLGTANYTSGTATNYVGDAIANLSLYAYSSTPTLGSTRLDNVRLGNSLSDVAVIPEPSASVALLGFAALGFSGLHRGFKRRRVSQA